MMRTAFAAMFALALSVPAFAEDWPIRRFQVVEMTVDEIAGDTGGALNDMFDAVAGALSDDPAGFENREDQRADLEAFLNESPNPALTPIANTHNLVSM